MVRWPAFDTLPKNVNPERLVLANALALPAHPRDLDPHPDDGPPMQVLDERYGPYIKHGKVNATLPKGVAPTALGLPQALELLAAKAGQPAVKRTKMGSRAKSKG